MKKIFFLPLMIMLIFLKTAVGQEIDLTVNINTEQVPTGFRDYLNDFGDRVKSYINDYRWTSEDYLGEKIKCTMTFYFTAGSADNKYSAQVFIGTQRPVYKSKSGTIILRLLDDKWDFIYVKSQPLYHNESQFDPLASFLDFYAYMILGYDAETFSMEGGTPYFQKAADIVNRAISSAFTRGWTRQGSAFTRQALVEDLLNAKYTEYQKSIFHLSFSRPRFNIYKFKPGVG